MSTKKPATRGAQPMMSTRTMQWVATKTPATSVGTAMQDGVSAASKSLTAGIQCQKITSRGKVKHRVLTISEDRLALFCTHQPVKSQNAISTIASKLPLPAITRKGVWGFTGDLRDRYVRYMDIADIDYVCSSTVSTRRQEQARTKNRLQGKDSKIDQEKEEIVTIGHHGDQTLDVLVSNEKERKQLITCIKQMMKTFQEAEAHVSHDALLLRYIWYDVDANRDGKINEREFIKIMNRINFNVKNPSKVFRKFCKSRNLKTSGVSLADILALLMIIKNKEGNGSMSMANLIWRDLFGDHLDVVDANIFLTRFVHGVQGETEKTLSDVKELFVTINTIEIDHCEGEPANIVIDQQISRPRFEVYLYHEFNDAYRPDKIEPDDIVRLNRPMAGYFINTSHNTYLTGDQIQSSSSVEMYAKALRRGCKCLELDCWDGEKSKTKGVKSLHPVVFHGHTLTSKILFSDILQVVKNYMDDNPDTYPIILSLENHCSHDFQSVMAQLLTDTFRGVLYVPSESPNGDLPSPESLRGKVVIKGKRPPDPDDNPTVLATEEDEEDEIDPYALDGGEPSPKGKAKQAKNKGDPKAPPAKPPKIVKELARLTLFHGTKFKSFETSIKEPESHMHSIGESKIPKILSKAPENADLWRKYNVHHMTRTYPAGARVDSSNYNPLLAWSVGCQLVALNFQTSDSPLILNDGLFRQNNGCGYLPKPRSVMVEGPKRSSPAQMLRIRILSGSCLPKPKGAKSGETIDPYVQVALHDVKASEEAGLVYERSSYYTSTVNDNGFCPVWNEQEGKSYPVYSPDVASVEFTLRETDITLDDYVGYAAIPMSCLRTGYRSIQLYDKNNTRSGPFSYASLLVDIQITGV